MEINSRAKFAYIRTIPYKENNGLKRSILNTLSFVTGVKKHRTELAKKFGDPDVIICCSMHPFTWIAAKKAADHFNSRFIVEVRGFWTSDEGISKFNPGVIIFNIIEKWASIMLTRTQQMKYTNKRPGRQPDFLRQKARMGGGPICVWLH